MPQTLPGRSRRRRSRARNKSISLGPVASQEAIKLLGDNGGGFFNANSAHPFENPSVWSNILQKWSQLVVPVALVFAFGRMVGEPRQGRALLIAMGVVFIVALAVIYWVEAVGNPALTVARRRSFARKHGGQGSALRSGGSGAVRRRRPPAPGPARRTPTSNPMMPLAGLIAMFNLLLGCISPGGVGTGLYSLMLLVFIAAFIGALMIGRTPEYLGKKINARDMQFAMFALLLLAGSRAHLRRRCLRNKDRARQPRRRRTAWTDRDCLRLCLERRR